MQVIVRASLFPSPSLLIELPGRECATYTPPSAIYVGDWPNWALLPPPFPRTYDADKHQGLWVVPARNHHIARLRSCTRCLPPSPTQTQVGPKRASLSGYCPW